MFKYAAMFVDKIGETLSSEGELVGRECKDGGKSGETRSGEAEQGGAGGQLPPQS